LRLQVLAAMGRSDDVLASVKELRSRMDELPLKSEAEEAVSPWSVREILLGAGRDAAGRIGSWETALAFNAEVEEVSRKRSADELTMACTSFFDYRPLLRLRRYDAARTLLLKCRDVFEAKRDVPGLGKMYSALADLEDETGDRASAVRFEEVALGYKYQAGQPEDRAISHNNLACYLEHQGADPATVMAHRLAAAILLLQMQSGLLSTPVSSLASSELPPTPPTFAEVIQRVELIEGVHFGALFDRLPRTTLNGDATIAAVWNRVADEKRRQDDEWQPFLQAIADAVNDKGSRAQIEPKLVEKEQDRWRLTEAVHRIWAGERDSEALTAGLDRQDTELVRRLLGILKP
jgi:hypothetical protein